MNIQNYEPRSIEIFRPAHLRVLLGIILLAFIIFLIGLVLPETNIIYLFVFFFLTSYLLVSPIVKVENGFIQKRNSFGVSSQKVDLNRLSELYVYKRFEPRSWAILVHLEDAIGNAMELRLEDKSAWTAQYWSRSPYLKKLLDYYASRSNIQYDDLTAKVLR